MFEAEWKRMQKKLNRLMHDQVFTNRIVEVPENEFRRTDDKLKKRLGLYDRSSNDEGFKVYFKGTVNANDLLAGVGVAIYDARHRCVFELGKLFLISGEEDRDLVKLRALIECVYAAVTFGLNRIDICCASNSAYHYITGKDRPRNKMTVPLVDSLILIQKKVGYRVHGPLNTRRENVKFVYKLAKSALASHTSKSAEKDDEQCTICLQTICKRDMFSVNKCLHRYCHACMNKHVESKLLIAQLPNCPHDKCRSKLDIKSCKQFLNKNLYDIMSFRLIEAAIPPAERVYCPFSKCSALMSKTELQYAASTSSQEPGKRKCSQCDGVFCMNCKVPWHDKSECSASQFVDEEMLKSLATSNKWRQCVKCKHMIELAAGCHHITCRCGYEFCYKCGAGWIKKIAGCTCPLWEIDNILYA
ncbi:hypothetical protein QVD17_11736 [Tagetes erecta]|uniref:RBR-type E3 ubiquitin transferase n=1 Tax=Tagetes erecta TaxID=13708 RepID=A0AAD8NV84_TARER|nr:hypothetical protein QVD17_11736 [Tagetes erecta]